MNIYDKLYTDHPVYTTNMSEATHFTTKFEFVQSYVKDKSINTILDVGCGHGTYLRALRDLGFDVYGVEYSQVCCDTYLQDIPHVCASVVDYVNTPNVNYDSLICLDVLEHLNYNEIPLVLKGFSEISNTALLGIANHSDIIHGVELHIIREDVNWWIEQLKPHFKNIKHIQTLYNGMFFFIEVSN